MAKFEVQVRRCFCCGLSLGTIFIALYTLFLYSLLTGLALWALSDTVANGDNSYYNSCEMEAEGKIRADNRKIVFDGGQTKVVVEDSTSYHCSFGLYTEEQKFSKLIRYSLLVFNIGIYVLMILASVILLVGLVTYSEWLLIPWLVLMAVEIIRGIISTLLIFFFSHGNLARIATGIFFLGLQFFHISLWIIIFAKFQRIYARKRGIVLDVDKQYDARGYPTATLPSNYAAYSPNSQQRGGQPPPPAHHGPPSSYPYSDYSPSQKDYSAPMPSAYGGGGGPATYGQPHPQQQQQQQQQPYRPYHDVPSNGYKY